MGYLEGMKTTEWVYERSKKDIQDNLLLAIAEKVLSESQMETFYKRFEAINEWRFEELERLAKQSDDKTGETINE